MKTLISTVYEPEPTIAGIMKTTPDKLILVYDQNPAEKVKEAVNKIKQDYKNIIPIEELKIDVYNIPETIEKLVKKIDQEKKANNSIHINLTSGRKTVTIACLYAAMKRDKAVDEIFYIREEDHEKIGLPHPPIRVSKLKECLLEAIEEHQPIEKSRLKELIQIKEYTLNQYISEMLKSKLIDAKERAKYTITEKGRIYKTLGKIQGSNGGIIP